MPTPIKIENIVDTIEFEIEGRVYAVPLATGMKREELDKLDTQKALEGFFMKHLGAETWNKLNVGAQNRIASEWNKATEEANGISLGKSSASQDS